MSGPQAPCPAHSVVYNKTLCACAPGYLFNATTKSCTPFNLSPYDWVVNSGVDYSISFPETIFSFDQIKKFTQSQAVFLEITAFLLATWLLFCVLVRLAKLEDGRTVWFKIRWWISRLDICFSTKHYLVIGSLYNFLIALSFCFSNYLILSFIGFYRLVCNRLLH